MIRVGELYGISILGNRIIDRFKYKGKGRPRLNDYCTIEEAQNNLNIVMSDYLNFKAQRFRKT